MFVAKAIFLAIAAQSTSVYSESLRATTERALSQDKFFNFQPRTDVVDHSRVDLDQKAMEKDLAQQTVVGFQSALDIYQNGAHSKAYSVLTLSTPLMASYSKGTEVSGKSVIGNAQGGKLYKAANVGDNVISVQYATTRDCLVRGPEPNTNGCFASSGEIVIGSVPLTYSYNVESATKNGRTLQGFSTAAQDKMWSCANCPYDDYKKFYDYYGKFDYANQWIMAAFEGAETDFDKGNADFSKYSKEGQTEAIKKASSYMSVWMYVVRELEDALDDCNNNCAEAGCNDDQVSAWDEAVAFYVGSQEKGTGGYLPYSLANKRCANFGTCSDGTVGQASANNRIMLEYLKGQDSLRAGQCREARKNKEKIVQLMTIPLIQGTLRYAYIVGVQNDIREKPRAEGAVFAASVLPMVNACGSADATTIYNNMRVGNDAVPNFKDVKAAFENNYDCLGITCADIGGLVDRTDGSYLPGAKPCGNVASTTAKNKSSINSSATIFIAIGVTAGLILVAVVVVLVSCKSWGSKTKKDFDVTTEDLPPQSEGNQVS